MKTFLTLGTIAAVFPKTEVNEKSAYSNRKIKKNRMSIMFL